MLDLLIGPIASGKSTYCCKAAQEGSLIVNDDSIVFAVHGGQYTLYQKELKPLYKSIENHIIQMGVALGKNLVVDRPNHSTAMRRRYIGLAHSLDISVRAVIFKRESPEIHGKRRAQSNARNISEEAWIRVAEYHESLYEMPNQEKEQFDEIIWWEWPGIEHTSNPGW